MPSDCGQHTPAGHSTQRQACTPAPQPGQRPEHRGTHRVHRTPVDAGLSSVQGLAGERRIVGLPAEPVQRVGMRLIQIELRGDGPGLVAPVAPKPARRSARRASSPRAIPASHAAGRRPLPTQMDQDQQLGQQNQSAHRQHSPHGGCRYNATSVQYVRDPGPQTPRRRPRRPLRRRARIGCWPASRRAEGPSSGTGG